MPRSSTEPQGAHENPLLCRYASKRCWQPRSLKKNGALHNLCSAHRERANMNQQRLEQRRRNRQALRARGMGHRRLYHAEQDDAVATTTTTARATARTTALSASSTSAVVIQRPDPVACLAVARSIEAAARLLNSVQERRPIKHALFAAPSSSVSSSSVVPLPQPQPQPQPQQYTVGLPASGHRRNDALLLGDSWTFEPFEDSVYATMAPPHAAMLPFASTTTTTTH